MKAPIDFQNLYFVFYSSGKSHYQHIRPVNIRYHCCPVVTESFPLINLLIKAELAGETEKLHSVTTLTSIDKTNISFWLSSL